MYKTNVYIALLTTAFLTACGSSEPSESDITNALMNQIKAQLEESSGIFKEEDMTIRHIKKVGCNKAEDQSGYLCDVDIDVSVKLPYVGVQNQTGIRSFRFVKTDQGWSVVQ